MRGRTLWVGEGDEEGGMGFSDRLIKWWNIFIAFRNYIAHRPSLTCDNILDKCVQDMAIGLRTIFHACSIYAGPVLAHNGS